MLPVVSQGFETWSLTLRQEHGLRVFKNRVLRITSGPKTVSVMGGWKNCITYILHQILQG